MSDRFKTLPRARIEVWRPGGHLPHLWYWRAKAGNSKIVGGSEQGLSRRDRTILKARKQFPDLQIFILDKDGNWYPLADQQVGGWIRT